MRERQEIECDAGAGTGLHGRMSIPRADLLILEVLLDIRDQQQSLASELESVKVDVGRGPEYVYGIRTQEH